MKRRQYLYLSRILVALIVVTLATPLGRANVGYVGTGSGNGSNQFNSEIKNRVQAEQEVTEVPKIYSVMVYFALVGTIAFRSRKNSV